MKLNRREFLVAGLAGPLLARQRSDPEVLFDRGFARVYKVANGLYVTIADADKGPQCYSNGAVLAGQDAVLIVEGHFQRPGAELELEVARAVSRARIRAAVNTHYHFDHTFGNVAYADQRIPIIAHEGVAQLMNQKYVALKGVDKRPLLAAEERKVANAADATEKTRRAQDLPLFTQMYGAIDATAIALPTERLAPRDLPKRLELGGLTAILESFPGHTPGDLIVRVPEYDVVFTGDLLFYRSYPVSIDADMIAWRKTLDRFAGYSRQTRFVPGHGPICRLEVVHEQRVLFDDLRTHAEHMIRAGATVDEAERRYVVPKQFQSFGIYGWGWSIGPAIQSYYRALKKSA